MNGSRRGVAGVLGAAEKQDRDVTVVASSPCASFKTFPPSEPACELAPVTPRLFLFLQRSGPCSRSHSVYRGFLLQELKYSKRE